MKIRLRSYKKQDRPDSLGQIEVIPAVGKAVRNINISAVKGAAVLCATESYRTDEAILGKLLMLIRKHATRRDRTHYVNSPCVNAGRT